MICEQLMRHFLQRVGRFIRSEDRPTAVEVGLVLALILIVYLMAVQTLGSNIKTSFNNSANSIAS